MNISKFDALEEHELLKTNGGFYFTLMTILVTSNSLFGMAVYGSYMDGYNAGKAAAGN